MLSSAQLAALIDVPQPTVVLWGQLMRKGNPEDDNLYDAIDLKVARAWKAIQTNSHPHHMRDTRIRAERAIRADADFHPPTGWRWLLVTPLFVGVYQTAERATRAWLAHAPNSMASLIDLEPELAWQRS